MKNTGFRTSPLVGGGVKFNAGVSHHWEVTIVILAVSLVHAGAAVPLPKVSTLTADHAQFDKFESYRRVLLLREGLPQPQA